MVISTVLTEIKHLVQPAPPGRVGPLRPRAAIPRRSRGPRSMPPGPADGQAVGAQAVDVVRIEDDIPADKHQLVEPPPEGIRGRPASGAIGRLARRHASDGEAPPFEFSQSGLAIGDGRAAGADYEDDAGLGR